MRRQTEWTPRGEEWGPADPDRVGPARRTAYALVALNLDVVSRATVRELLPSGTRRRFNEGHVRRQRMNRTDPGKGANRVSEAFLKALRRFEEQGWLQRGQRYLLIRDKQALLDYALDGLRSMPRQLLRLDAAIARINDELKQAELTPAAVEQAQRERHAIMALMRSEIRGASWSGRGSVRRVGPAGSGE